MPDQQASALPTLAIIAGGEGKRMGGEIKCLLTLNGATILEQNITKLQPFTRQLLINSNAKSNTLKTIADKYGAVVISDSPGFKDCGPLAGLVSSLRAVEPTPSANNHPSGGLITVPSDCPFLPENLITALTAAATKTPNKIICASSLQRTHYMTAYWPAEVLPRVETFLQNGQRAVRHLLNDLGYCTLDFPTHFIGNYECDPFFNINTQEDYAQAKSFSNSPAN